ncbi:MAG: lipoyl domain-containing protein [Acidimicrobiales bacterium]
MILRLELPALGPQMDVARLVRWHAAPGDVVDYGDDIYEIVVDQIATLRRPTVASRIVGLGRGRSRDEHLVQSLEFRAVVTATDRGVLREAIVPEGGEVRPGSLLALLTPGPDEPTADDEPQSVFRSVLNARDDQEARDR